MNYNLAKINKIIFLNFKNRFFNMIKYPIVRKDLTSIDDYRGYKIVDQFR